MEEKDYYINEPDQYVKLMKIKKRGKERTIVTYAKSPLGYKLKRCHKRVLYFFSSFDSSKHSIAYKRGFCTKDSFIGHENSKYFIKLDIHSFFESITYDKFIEIRPDVIERYDERFTKACFYNGHLSLGFITSPIISDLYMYNFDKQIEDYLDSHNELHYTRYSDDILISSENEKITSLQVFEEKIKSLLSEYGLSINESKKAVYDMSKCNSVKFVGLNFSKKDDGFNITVSKDFIVKTLEMIPKMQKAKTEKRRIQLARAINSRVAYIKFNSDASYKRFLKKYTNRFAEEWKPYDLKTKRH